MASPSPNGNANKKVESSSNLSSTTTQNARTLKEIAGITGDGAVLFLSSVKESTDFFPPLKSAAAGILLLVDAVSKFKRNKEEWNDLARIVAERVAGIAKHVGSEPSPDLEDSLRSLSRLLESINDEVQQMQMRGRVTRALSVQADKEKIASFYTRMKNELDTLSLLANLTVLKIGANTSSQSPPGPLESDINWVPPPPPIHFYGRDEYLQTMLNYIERKVKSNTGAHLLIRGPGGIGKTSVAQTLFHHEIIETLFGTNRYFVRCDAASNQPLLLSAIASALHLDISRKDALSTILSFLRSGKEPIFLVLDNAETFWQALSRDAVRIVLQHISTIKRITLILTMRGIEQPTAVKWDPLPPLESLSLAAARETYLAIAEIPSDPEETATDDLDELLREVDCVPLAITLLARVSQTGGGDVISLRSRLRKEKSDLMNLGPIDREDNLGISIKLSLESQLMKQNPDALRLLRVLALLPLGALISNLESITAMLDDEVHKGCHTLKHLLLASESYVHRLISLSPVRLYIMKNYPPYDIDMEKLRNWHIELASSAQYTLQNDDYPPNLNILRQEKGNVAHILELTLTTGHLDEPSLTGVVGFSRFLADFDIPNPALLQIVLAEKRKGTFESGPNKIHIIVAVCLSLLGSMKHKQGDFAEAERLFQETGYDFKNNKHWFNVAETLLNLGNVNNSQGKYAESISHIEAAKSAFEKLGRKSNVAICLESLGDIKRMQGEYEEAEELLKEARSEFQKLVASSNHGGQDAQFNAARCLYSLGEIRAFQSSFSESEALLEQARLEFEKIGSRNGLAPCLRSLGNTKRMLLQFSDARKLLDEAIKEFRILGFRHDVAQCLYSLGDMTRYQRKFSEAQRYLEEARSEYKLIGLPTGANHCLYCLATMKVSQGLYTEADQLLDEVLVEYRALEMPFDVARCLFSLGNSKRFQLKFAEAESILLDAKTRFENTGHPYDGALCLQHLGDMKITQNQLAEAEDLLKGAQTIFRSQGRSFELAGCLSSLGKIRMQQTKYLEAESLFVEARAEYKANSCEKQATDAYVNVAGAVRLQSRLKESRRLLEEARAECQSLGMQYTAARCLYTVGEIKYDEIGEAGGSAFSNALELEWVEAKRCFSEAVEELRALSDVQPGDLGTHIMKFGGYALLAKDYDAARALLQESLDIFQSPNLASHLTQCQQPLSAIPEGSAGVPNNH